MATDPSSTTIKKVIGRYYRKLVPYPAPDKGHEELAFWKREYEREGKKFQNHWYRKNMLAMAGEQDDTFLSGKVLADFGCGPRGSLEWAASAQIRIGIDVLADAYRQNFDLSSHMMDYVNCTETTIPLETESVDVVYTVNAMDHVDNFDSMCSELLRILKPGGDFIGSFNLHEPPTPCEPQTLDEDIIKRHLLNRLQIRTYRVAPKGPEGQRYKHFWDNKVVEGREEAFLWVRATKPL